MEDGIDDLNFSEKNNANCSSNWIPSVIAFELILEFEIVEFQSAQSVHFINNQKLKIAWIH